MTPTPGSKEAVALGERVTDSGATGRVVAVQADGALFQIKWDSGEVTTHSTRYGQMELFDQGGADAVVRGCAVDRHAVAGGHAGR